MLKSAKPRLYVAGLVLAAFTCLATLSTLPPGVGAQSQTFSISGRVDSNGFGTGTPAPDVTMTLTNNTTGATLNTQTDANGQYSFTGLAAGGEYTVSPSKSGFTFNPTSRGFSNLGQNWTSQNFAATATATATVQFSGASYSASESEHAVQITVTRSAGAGSASVAYSTSDGTASSRRDYTFAAGTLAFADGQTSKTFTVLLADDTYAEGDETVQLTLSQPTGAALGAPAAATLTITSNDAAGLPNPIDGSEFFVRQHYHDFLNREPDASGLAFWVGDIEQCGADAACRQAKRINVSAAFFLSIEFQQTGYLVYTAYKAAYGDATSPNVPGTVPVIRLNEFLLDAQRIGQGVVVGATGWEQQLESNKQAYFLEFVGRGRFVGAFPGSLTPTQFVDALNTNAGGVLDAAERTNLINELTANNTNPGRASVLRKVAEDADLRQREFNRAFVLMQFYGYLRRNPDDPQDTDFRGWRFWLDKLEQFNGNYIAAEMVKAFLDSVEYRQRFGQ